MHCIGHEKRRSPIIHHRSARFHRAPWCDGRNLWSCARSGLPSFQEEVDARQDETARDVRRAPRISVDLLAPAYRRWEPQIIASETDESADMHRLLLDIWQEKELGLVSPKRSTVDMESTKHLSNSPFCFVIVSGQCSLEKLFLYFLVKQRKGTEVSHFSINSCLYLWQYVMNNWKPNEYDFSIVMLSIFWALTDIAYHFNGGDGRVLAGWKGHGSNAKQLVVLWKLNKSMKRW